ncbi:hypothetical protein JI664_07475 [Rhodobacter sp. NTK016B]|uniref:darcynin family protein n=1 Tax=Rhodobacter sp. NTK016B TaxID=2759676 RepID=UPI001A8C12BF|nr:darcynin family protein [Rhodobacter sp. NTK016B]MBN8291800.1 hypothetical protein [Rhodobacter sp. NTK016B]
MTLQPTDNALSVFILVRALPAWLALSRPERRRIGQEAAPVEPGIGFRAFDCEAFSAMCSDLWMLDVPSPGALNRVIERLRDTPLFTAPYFDLVAILPAIEDGWQRYEADLAG